MPSRYNSTTGIVFKTNRSRDADLVVHILTEKGERVVAMARGIKKATSRKAHAIDLLNLIRVSFSDGRGMPLITESKLISSNGLFKNSYKGLMFAQVVCELVDTFAQENQEEPAIYRNLTNLLQAEPQNLDFLLAATILRFLYISGELPQLAEDVETGEAIDPGSPRFLATAGYSSQNGGELIPDRIYKTQKFILGHDFAAAQKVSLAGSEVSQLLNIHIYWLQNAIERKLKTLEMYLAANGQNEMVRSRTR